MSISKHPCRLIQREMALGRVLSPEDQDHVLSCGDCSEEASRFGKLDALVRSAMKAEVPKDFADKVVGRLEAEGRRDERAPARRPSMLEKVLFSRAVQWALAGIGAVVGLMKIIRFFAGVLSRASI